MMGWQDDTLNVKGKPKWESDPIVSAAASEGAAIQGKPLFDIRAGLAVPTLIAMSANPFSAGRYPLGRFYTIGDEATFKKTDIFSGIGDRLYTDRVTMVNFDEDRVEFNNGKMITDLMGNMIKNGSSEYDIPVQYIPAEFQVGKKWTAAFSETKNEEDKNVSFEMRIMKRETISVPAGIFDTFRVEGKGLVSSRGSREVKLWLVPGMNFEVRSEYITKSRKGRYRKTERYELVSMRQQTSDMNCAASTGGLQRNLVIKSNCAA
jgi:hypothetical protein